MMYSRDFAFERCRRNSMIYFTPRPLRSLGIRTYATLSLKVFGLENSMALVAVKRNSVSKATKLTSPGDPWENNYGLYICQWPLLYFAWRKCYSKPLFREPRSQTWNGQIPWRTGSIFYLELCMFWLIPVGPEKSSTHDSYLFRAQWRTYAFW